MTYRYDNNRNYGESRDSAWEYRQDPYIGEGYESDSDPDYRYESFDEDYDPYLPDDLDSVSSNDESMVDRHDPQINDYSSAQPAAGIRISDHDLIDVNRENTKPRLRKALGSIAAALIALGVIGMVMVSIKPDVSAYDIVSMDDYEGEQRPDWALDPKEMAGCKSAAACIREKLSFFSSGAAPDKTPQTLAASALKEIPASTKNNVSVISAGTETMFVTQQWSNIRSQPLITSEIITSIASGKEVEIRGKSGVWYNVVTLDGESVSGYMHRSTLK